MRGDLSICRNLLELARDPLVITADGLEQGLDDRVRNFVIVPGELGVQNPLRRTCETTAALPGTRAIASG